VSSASVTRALSPLVFGMTFSLFGLLLLSVAGRLAIPLLIAGLAVWPGYTRPPLQIGPGAGFKTRAASMLRPLREDVRIVPILTVGDELVPPDSTVPLTLAVVGGRDFHSDPNNFASYWDPLNNEAWLERLSQENFAQNAIWAGWVYDSPGFDTDGDGYRGKCRGTASFGYRSGH